MLPLFGDIQTRGRQVQTEAAVTVDFTGGLRLGPGGSPVASNEVREALNVWFPESGGIERRCGIMPFAEFPSGTPNGDLIEFKTSSGDVEYYIECGSTIWRVRPGVGLVDTGWDLPGGDPLRGVQVGKSLYFGRGGNGKWRRWDGVAADPEVVDNAMRTDDFESTGVPDFSTFKLTGIPKGAELVNWNGRLWVAGAAIETEAGSYVYNASNREYDFVPDDPPALTEEDDPASVHFSFSFGIREREGPEDFYREWAYRFEPNGSDAVLKMIPLGEQLFCFLNSSVHVLSPYLGERSNLFYDVQRFQTDVGMVGKHAAAVDGSGIWFYDRIKGLMRVGSDGALSGHMDKIESVKDLLLDDLSSVAVGVWREMVWVSVPEIVDNQPAGNTATYVYNSRLDSWTKFDLGIESFTNYAPGAGTAQPRATFLGVVSSPISGVIDLQHENEHDSDWYSPSVGVPIESHVATSWFDADFPEVVKQWLGVEFLFRASPDQRATIKALIDWDVFNKGARWVEDIDNPTSFDDGKTVPSAWATVGTGVYSVSYTEETLPTYSLYYESSVQDDESEDPRERPARRGEVIDPEVSDATRLAQPVRLGRICASRAVSFRIEPRSTTTGRWALDRLSIFYKRKPIRT